MAKACEQHTYIDPERSFFMGSCFDSVHALVQLNREEAWSICSLSNTIDDVKINSMMSSSE